jgi:hypothetical protein
MSRKWIHEELRPWRRQASPGSCPHTWRPGPPPSAEAKMAGKKKSLSSAKRAHQRLLHRLPAVIQHSGRGSGVASAMDGVAVYGVLPPSAFVISGRTSSYLEEACQRRSFPASCRSWQHLRMALRERGPETAQVRSSH